MAETARLEIGDQSEFAMTLSSFAKLSTSGALLVAMLPTSGFAAEVCVECSEPAAQYRCIVPDHELATLRLPSKAIHFVCMTELAKQGSHRFCRVSQRPLGGLCAGQERTVSLDGRDDAGTGEAALPGPEETAEMTQKAPPATLADLAKQTAKSSGQGLEKAGTAIKNGASEIGDRVGSAVDCVVSLFKRC